MILYYMYDVNIPDLARGAAAFARRDSPLPFGLFGLFSFPKPFVGTKFEKFMQKEYLYLQGYDAPFRLNGNKLGHFAN